jgi:branched-chain amino acid transport system substrate-binding protein
MRTPSLQFGLLPVCLAGAFAFAASIVPANAQQDFKIGVVMSVTGPFAGPARDTMDGYEGWMKARGLPGKKVVLETLDDETNSVNASNAFRRLTGNPDVKLIYLFVPSSSVMAVKTLASEFKTPIIAGGAADAIGIPADPYLFKVAPATRDFMTRLAQYVKGKGYKRLAMLEPNDSFGQAEMANMRKFAPEYGIELVAVETFGVEDTNFNAQLTRIRAANPDVIYDGAAGRAAILTFKNIKQLGLTQPLIMGQSVVAKPFFEGIGGAEVADGLLVPIQLGSFGTSSGGETAKLYEELGKGMGRTPVYYNTFGFDVGLITEGGVKGSDGSRQGIRDALEKLKGMPALNGPVTYTAEDHTGQNFESIGMGKLEKGVPVYTK